MKNYIIADIETIPEVDLKDKKLKHLYEYLELARKAILYHAPKGYIAKMLSNSEDAISMIAYKIMLADMKYQQGKGSNENTWRNKLSEYAVLDFLESYKKTKNNKSVNNFEPMELINDGKQYSPTLGIGEAERIGRIRNRLNFAIENSKLSEVQKQCLSLRYFESEPDGNQLSYQKIGERLNPPIRRQAVEQNIKRALAKLKFTLKSENG